MTESRYTPEIRAAEAAELEKVVRRAMDRWRGDEWVSEDDLVEQFGSKAGHEAVRRLRASGEYPRKRTTLEDMRRAVAPGVYGGPFAAVNFNRRRRRRSA